MSWKSVAIAEVSNVVTGSTPKTDRDDFFGGAIPFVTPAELEQANPIVATPRTLSDAGAQQVRIVPENAVLVCCIGSLGKVGIAGRALATNQQINAVVFDERKVWPRFGYYACRLLKPTLENMAPATTVAIVSKSKFQTLEIPLPPLEDQKRIAAVLDQADELRRKRQRALDRLNQLGQAIFIEMFGDPKSNPKGWSSARLGDLCEVGSSKRVFVEEFVDSGVPFYRGTEVGKLGAGETISPDLFIAPEHYNDLVAHSGKPEIGDLLLPSICHDGRIWKVDSPDPFYFKDGRVLWIKSHQAEIDCEYLRRYLQNRFLLDYTSIASGTTFAELKIVNLKNLKVLNPPVEFQAAFSSRISAIEAIRPFQIRALSEADSLFASLQHRAFQGELTASSLKEAAA